MDESHIHKIDQDMTVKKGYLLYDSIYVKFKKCKPYCGIRIRETFWEVYFGEGQVMTGWRAKGNFSCDSNAMSYAESSGLINMLFWCNLDVHL